MNEIIASRYERIERNGRRGICKNVFHRSEFGKKTEDLWEKGVVSGIEKRIDIKYLDHILSCKKTYNNLTLSGQNPRLAKQWAL